MEDILEPRKTALIVADMQGDIVSHFAFDKGVVGRMAQAAAEARKRGLLVIYVKVNFRPDGRDQFGNITDAGLAMARSGQAGGLPEDFLAEGSPGAEIVDELKPQPHDYVVVKRRTSAFYGTSLELFLRSAGIDTILIGGIATNMVVEGTVREARDRNFHSVVLSDCCSAPSKEVHEWTLANGFRWMARVRTTSEAMALLDSFAGTAPQSES